MTTTSVDIRARNRLAEAEALLRRAVEIWEQRLGPNHPYVATGIANLAQVLRFTNRLTEAESLYRRALEVEEPVAGPAHTSPDSVLFDT